jgi:hypothetical protein
LVCGEFDCGRFVRDEFVGDPLLSAELVFGALAVGELALGEVLRGVLVLGVLVPGEFEGGEPGRGELIGVDLKRGETIRRASELPCVLATSLLNDPCSVPSPAISSTNVPLLIRSAPVSVNFKSSRRPVRVPSNAMGVLAAAGSALPFSIHF